MRKPLLISAAALLLLSSSCKKDDNIVGPTSQSPPLSESQRASALRGVEEALAAASHQNMGAGNAALVAYLRSQPDFTASGIADTGGNVWARFTDGRLLIIANNRPVSGDTSSPEPPLSRHMPVGDPLVDNLPGSKKARIMNAMGSWFVDPSPVLSGMLSSKGYEVTREQGTVEKLMQVSGDGVFYFDTHGGNGERRDRTEIIALWTATPRTPQLDTAYTGMLDADELCYFTAKNNRSGDTATIETHYGITDWFVLHHMSFGRNCLIYIDACRSFVNRFIISCVSKSENNSGTFVSWSNYVDDSKAYKVMKFVFDRLLGTNYTNIPWTENPPQRPFDIDLVWQDMEGRTPPINKYTDNSVPGNPQIAMLQYKPGPNSHFLLAPSIKFLWVDEIDRKLVVTGTFGKDPRSDGTGTVTVNGNLLTIQSWNNDGEEIICSIPPTGTSAAGDVIVTVRGHESNVVQLTEWIGEIRMRMTSGYVGMNLAVTFSLHLRADVHSFRERPHETPQAASQILTFGAPDTRGNWSFGGTNTTHYTSVGCNVVSTETWANNSGGLPIVYFSGGPPNGVLMDFEIQPRARTMKVRLDASATNVINWSCVDSITCSGPTIGVQYSGVSSFSTSIFNRTAPGFDTLTLSFAPNFDILPSTTQRPNQMNPFHGGDPNATQTPTGLTTIECAGIQARYRPDPNAGQRPLASTRRRR